MTTTARNTTRRDKHRRTISADEPPCGICRQPINYTLPHQDPRSFVVDHIIPLALGGTDTLDNKQAAHRKCNRDKGDNLDWKPGVTFITDRNWWNPDATPRGAPPNPDRAPPLRA